MDIIRAKTRKLKGEWRVIHTMSNWSWSCYYGWMWIGPYRPWTKILEWWYNR
jgi:hypothetical protein